MNRRTFIKNSGKAGIYLTIASHQFLFNSCTTTPGNNENEILFPPLPGKKIQPPVTGCFIGFNGTAADAEYYEAQLDKKPKIMVCPDNWSKTFLSEWVAYIDAQGCIPMVRKQVKADMYIAGGFEELITDKKFTESLEMYADQIVQYGKPFFFVPMWEMNNSNKEYPWGAQPAKIFIGVWQKIWQIFENKGANQYATYIWYPYIGGDRYRYNTRYPDYYYPGDKYVDWIGLSAYSRLGGMNGDISYKALVSGFYNRMRRNHPNKPFIQAEFGRTQTGSQKKWLEKAYSWIRQHSGVKAAVYWDNVYRGPHGTDDHKLHFKSYDFLELLFKDPYWIGGEKSVDNLDEYRPV